MQLFNNKMQDKDNDRQQSLMNVNWSDLWDRTELVSGHTQKGIEFLERYGQFIKDRAVIEEEYAAKLRNLAKKSRGKKNEEDCKLYSYLNAFYSILGELESLAGQHEVIGETLKREVVPVVLEKVQHFRTNRKKQCAIFQALTSALHESEDIMIKAQKVYLKAFREAEIAYVKHDKAEKNMELSRLDLERAKNNVHQKNQVCEQTKQSYAHSLELANDAQYQHFNVKLPTLLEEMRKLDVDRIESTKQTMLESVNAETGVSNILQRCYADMKSAISSINPEKDAMIVVVEHKTGFSFPEEHVFEDLGCPSSVLVSNGESMVDSSTLKRNSTTVTGVKGKNANGKAIPRKSSMHQRLFGGASSAKANHNVNSTDDYCNLPPQQRCRKIQSKLDELSKETVLKEQARAGLERMLVVYKDNPKMGNASDVEQQIQQYNKELDVIAEKANWYKKLLIDAQSELNTPLGGVQEPHHPLRTVASYATGLTNGGSPRVHASTTSLVSSTGLPQRSSYSEESVSSESSASTNHANNSVSMRTSLNSFSTTNNSNGANGNGAPNGFHKQTPVGVVSAKSNISVATTAFTSLNVANNNNGIQNIDSNSADFYEEFDGPSSVGLTADSSASKVANKNENGQSSKALDLTTSILGTCTALYAFEGSSDGTTIAMHEGDEMLLLERDEGDGWTRVRLMTKGKNSESPMEGFVPTTYLQCRWYSTA